MAKHLVGNKVSKLVETELQYEAFTGIVTEGLVRALPLQKESLSLHLDDIKSYVGATLRSMDALRMLDTAYESATEMPKKAFLHRLKDAVETVPNESSIRIATENASAPTMNDVMGKASFTDKEMKSLVNKVDNLDIPEVARVVRNKVVEVLKDERAAYEQEEVVKQELAQIVSQQVQEVEDKLQANDATFRDSRTDISKTGDSDFDIEDTTDESLDSFLDMILPNSAIRSHVSVFSKLQDAAVEAIMLNGIDEDDELPIGILSSVTESSVFGITAPEKNTIELVDQLSASLESVIPECPTSNIVETAHICAITVYTLLELLKTMNLYSPKVEDVKKFVHFTPKIQSIKDVETSLRNTMLSNIQSIKDKIPTMDKNQLGVAFDSCNEMQSQVDLLRNKHQDLYNTVVENLGVVTEMLRSQISAKSGAIETSLPPSILRMKSANTAAFTGLEHRYGRRSDVATLQIELDPASEANYVSVKAINPAGAPIEVTAVTLERNPRLGNLLQIVTESINSSSLYTSNKKVSIYDVTSCKFLNT